MSLVDVRTKCVDFSGRTDLVINTTAFADDGMDWFIEAGRKFLDSLLNTENAEGIYSEVLAIGDDTVDFGACRSILDVWFLNLDGDRVLPKQLTFNQFKDTFTENPATATNGEPMAWTPNILRSIDTPVDANNILKGVIFSPPLSEAWTIKVKGLFFSGTLTDDADENYWTQLYPDILVYATLYKLEISYRNTEGAKDWLNSIRDAIVGLDFDTANQVASGRSQMVG